MLWRHDLAASGVGNSSRALLDLAPEVDADTSEPVEGRLQEVHRPLTPAKPSDEVKPNQCWRCGLVPKWAARHKRASDCIHELRMLLGSKKADEPPHNPAGCRGKKAAAVG
jgi:hypothetical protein